LLILSAQATLFGGPLDDGIDGTFDPESLGRAAGEAAADFLSFLVGQETYSRLFLLLGTKGG